MAVLDVGELEQIVGGDSYNPGTLNWVNGMGKVLLINVGPRTPFDDKFKNASTIHGQETAVHIIASSNFVVIDQLQAQKLKASRGTSSRAFSVLTLRLICAASKLPQEFDPILMSVKEVA